VKKLLSALNHCYCTTSGPDYIHNHWIISFKGVKAVKNGAMDVEAGHIDALADGSPLQRTSGQLLETTTASLVS
jgi:hypothetical protein